MPFCAVIEVAASTFEVLQDCVSVLTQSWVKVPHFFAILSLTRSSVEQ